VGSFDVFSGPKEYTMFAFSPTFRLEFLARTDFLLLFVLESSSSSISFCRRAGFAKSADLALLPPPRVVVCDILLLIIAGALHEEDVSIIDINFFVSEVSGVKKTERERVRERARELINTDERRRVCRFVSGKTESAHKRRKGNKTKKKRIK
jgi:hypothetical protein